MSKSGSTDNSTSIGEFSTQLDFSFGSCVHLKFNSLWLRGRGNFRSAKVDHWCTPSLHMVGPCHRVVVVWARRLDGPGRKNEKKMKLGKKHVGVAAGFRQKSHRPGWVGRWAQNLVPARSFSKNAIFEVLGRTSFFCRPRRKNETGQQGHGVY